MKRLLHVIADYRPMSQEFGEIVQRIWTQNWDLDLVVVPTAAPPMDTVGTGYLTAQLALGENPPGTVLYVNAALRKERKEAMDDNAGERLVWARLTNGVEVVAVNSGFSLSLVREHVAELRAVEVHVEINGKRVTALVTGGVFSVDEGELAWSVGSSGHGDPFMEVFLRGGSVADLFEHPHPGAEVVVTG